MDLTKVIERAKQGDKEAKEIIIERYKPLTYKMSAEFFIRGYDREDLIQIGYISILKAIEQFDLSKGQNFTSYVQYSLRNNFYSMVRDKYKEKYDSLTEDINKFIEYSKDDARRKKEGIAILPTFSSDIERIKVTATDIMEVLNTRDTTINSNTKGKVTTGGKNALLHEFSRVVSDMVASYNNMISTKVVD